MHTEWMPKWTNVKVVKVFDVKSTAKPIAMFQKLIVVAMMAEMP